MLEGTLIVLRSDPDQITLTAHRRITATSRPRDEHLAHTAAWRGFTITDRRNELDHRNHHVQNTHPGPRQIPEHNDPVCETDRQSG